MMITRRDGFFAVPAVLLVGLSVFLLGRDAGSFWAFYLFALVLGIAAMPLTGRLFKNFDDKGWCFSKVLAILISGFSVWFLTTCKVIVFSAGSSILVTLILAILCVWYLGIRRSPGFKYLPWDHARLILVEELLFIAIFLMWTYLAGFNPAANGTEKFMDYGFMEAMMRSPVLPAQDLWYSQGHINYYYGGQFFAVFLTKMTGTQVEITYNLSRMFVAAFAFILPFSLVYQMMADQLRSRQKKRYLLESGVAGVTAGVAVSIAGNMHYVVYAVAIPLLNKIKGIEAEKGYWFPDATRYIGFNPDVPDKTIHEFPCYSFILGDLHAHVVNIMFVLLLLGLLYAYLKTGRRKRNNDTGVLFIMKEIATPHIILASFLLGVYQWTNFWDFVIYFVVTGGTVLFTNVCRFRGSIRKGIGSTVVHAVMMALISTLTILPFTLQFETMVQGVALAQNHSLPHQLLVLWGLPTVLTILLIMVIIGDNRPRKEEKGLFAKMRITSSPDLFVVIIGLCAMGLVLIPELVYVRDIYENGNARANTMFKLTYQAYIMFGITMGYGIYRILMLAKKLIFRIGAVLVLFLLLCTVGYFGKSVSSWFGNVFDTSRYQGLNALAYLEGTLPEDAGGIRWLKANIQGHPVVLEANGDSYSTFERVSAATGLPTILGWYVHEWLWRNDTADLNVKSRDVETIYTSADEKEVRRLLASYDVSYIFVGSKENEKYAERLNRDLLHQLGEIVYEDPYSGTFIVKV